MFKYISLCIFSFKIIWELEEILFTTRIQLWKKANNLFLSFLAFTDKERPKNQLKKAMICGILSAIYDYDTDIVKTKNPSNSLFLQLLNKFDISELTKEIAKKLFIKDWKEKLSPSGLERGGVALQFYNAIIKSNWMSKYSLEEIFKFGEKLQIVDDILDYRLDKQNNHKNCFLSKNNSEFKGELLEFLKSDFFLQLSYNSSIYKLLRIKCKSNLKGMDKVRFKELFSTGRPKDMLFAFILSALSFKICGSFPITLVGLTSVSFALITGNIMSFNDYIDRHHDCKKGKKFAEERSSELLRYIYQIGILIILILISTALLDYRVALLNFIVWIVGLLYSFIPKWYIFQNLIVALCSASPILPGYVYTNRRHNPSIFIVFIIFFGIIFIREILKDTEDKEVDVGYKKTLPNSIRAYPKGAHVLSINRFYKFILKSIKVEHEKYAPKINRITFPIYGRIIPKIMWLILLFIVILFKWYSLIIIVPFVSAFYAILILISLGKETSPKLEEEKNIFLTKILKKVIDYLMIAVLIGIMFI